VGKEIKIESAKKRLLRGLACLIMAGFMLTATEQPARADGVVIDPAEIAANAAQYVLEAAQWVIQNLIAAAGNVAHSVGQMLQTQAAANIADVNNVNRRTDVLVQTAQNVAVGYTRPSNYSYCHVAQSSATADNNEQATKAMAQAYTQGNQARMADPVANAQEIKNECAMGFAPVTPRNPPDPETSAWVGLGCTAVNGGIYEKQDRNLHAVIGPLQYPVDPQYKPPQSGVLSPTTMSPPAAAYYPFDAALFFCQHIPTAQPLPPQAVSNKPTIDLLKMMQYSSAESAGSGASSACFQALAERMQFPADSESNFPSNNPVASGDNTRHGEQVQQCIEDHDAYYLDDNLLLLCRTNGRSELQAAHDRAFKNEMANYQSQVLAVLPTATAATITAANQLEEARWTQQQAAADNALADLVRRTLSIPSTGATSQPTQ
jgi:hypothetical protein